MLRMSALRHVVLSCAVFLATLIAAPAWASDLIPEKAAIAVGETTYIKLDARAAFGVKWSASPEIKILSSNGDGATVKGVSAGTATVTAKWLTNKKSTQITVGNVTAAKDQPDDDREAVRMEGLARAMGMPNLDARIARMLYEVNTGKRTPKRFYEGLRDAGAKMTDVIRVRKTLVDHPDQSFTRQVMGPTFSENGTPVEKTLLTWRRDQTKAAIDEVVKQFIDAGRVPANGFELIISHVGKWANQSDNSLTFTGDIDFSFVSNDTALAEAMKEAYLKAIQRRTGLDQIALDSVCTAHGKAGLEVYIGRHGMAFAEEQMKINEVVDMTTGARTRIEGDGAAMRVGAILTVERMMADAAGIETKQPVLNTEPGLSMEMARHFQHDIVEPKLFDLNNAVVKAAKYLDRSYKALNKAGGSPSDPALADFASAVTELANTKPQTKAVREQIIQRISDYLGSPPQTVWDMGTNKLVLTIDHAAVDRFHQDAAKALKETVRQGSNKRTEELDQRLRDLLERQARGDKVDEDVAKLRQEMVDMVDMVEAEIKAAHGMDFPIEVHTNNAKVRAMLDTLSKRFGVKALSPEELKDKKFVEELLRAQAASPSESRLRMVADYVMDRTAKAAELSMSGVEKTNQLLDIIDDRLLGPLRGDSNFAEFEAEMRAVQQAARDPRLRSDATARLAVVKTKVASAIKNTNLYLNDKLQATAAGRQGMKFMMVYGLVDEMQAYRDAFNEQGWGGFATEIFKRRIPFGGAVESAVMGNTLRAGWDVVTTLIPPLSLPEAAYGLGTSIGTQVKSTYWSEQLALFTDSLYADAIFKLEEVQTYQGAKVGVYRLVRTFYKGMPLDLHRFADMRKDQVDALGKEVEAGHVDWQGYKNSFNGLTEWLDVDATLKANLAASDPALMLLEEMANHPAVGPKLMDRLAEKGLARWEQVKLGYVVKLIKHLEDRKQADDALARGMLPDLFAELRKVAADLGVENEVMQGLDAEVDTNKLKSLIKWLWDAKRSALDQAPTESETSRAAQAVKKYLDAYKQVQSLRDQAAGQMGKAATDVNTRYLTTNLFLSGRADPDLAAARAWIGQIDSARKAMASALLSIKRTFLPKTALDGADQPYLDRAFAHEVWIKPYQDGQARLKKAWMRNYADGHAKERDKVLAEYKDWLTKLGPVQLTVTATDAKDGGKTVSGLKVSLVPTDELGQPVSAGAGGNQVVLGVAMGRYRLTASAPGYLEASKNVVYGRGLTATPSETIALSPSGTDDTTGTDNVGDTGPGGRDYTGVTVTPPDKVDTYVPTCSYQYGDWSACNRETKKQTRTVAGKTPAKCEERQKPVTEQACTPPPTEEELKNRYLNCLCRCSSGWASHIGVWYDPEGKTKPECESSGPCIGGIGAWGCSRRHFFGGPSDCAKGCWEGVWGKDSYDPDKADKLRKGENRKYKKPLTVKILASKNPADFGDIVDLTAETAEGSGGYQWNWGGCAQDAQDAQDASAKVLNSRECKSCSASVTVTDQDGDSASDSLLIRCTALKVKLTKERPAEDAIPVGAKAELLAQVFSGDKPADGSFTYYWEPNPDVQYGSDPKNPAYETSGGSESRNSAVFRRLGRTPVWVTVLKQVGQTKMTMGESEQIVIDVISPQLTVKADKTNPVVGEQVVVTVEEDPKMGDDLITFWWEYRGDANNPGVQPNTPNSRAWSYKPKNDKPVTITVHAKSKDNGDELDSASLTITAQKVQVSVTGPRIAGPAPMVWKEGIGLVAAERQVAEYMRVEFAANVSPAAGDLRYQWRAEPSGCSIHSPSARETGVTCSSTGSYTLTVTVTNADGAELGSGSGNLSVSVSDSDVKQAPKSKEAYDKMQQAKQKVSAGQLDEAITLASAAAALDAKNAEAKKLGAQWNKERDTVRQQVDRAKKALQANKPDAAQKEIDAARKLHPKYPPVVDTERLIADKRQTIAGGKTPVEAGVGPDAVAGTWTISAAGYAGKLVITREGSGLQGKIRFDALGQWETLTDVRFDGRTLSFTRPYPGATQRYNGTYSGNVLKGSFDENGRPRGDWSAGDFAGSASGPSGGLPAATLAGKWSTTEGELSLDQNGRSVSGRYSNDGGEIVGEMNGSVLDGYWIENGSNERCATAKNGRYFWGRIRWTFTDNRFGGTWSYCDKPVPEGAASWKGERIGAAPSDAAGAGGTGANLARGKPASQSSTSQWSRADDAQGAVDGVINGSYGFHTNNERNPWWQVDLGGPARIDEVRLYNRLDCCSERARTVQVLVSDDGRQWRTAYRHNGTPFGGKDGKPLSVALNGTTARYVRLQLDESNWLHLDEVEVYGQLTGGAATPTAGGLSESDLTSRTWRFGRSNGSMIAEPVRLTRAGRMEGYYHTNEDNWALDNGVLVFRDPSGQVVTRFTSVRNEAGRLVLSGPYRNDTSFQHVLTEVGRDSGVQPVQPAPVQPAAGKQVLEDDAGPYSWIEATEVQTRRVHAGRAAFHSTGNNHFVARLGLVGNYPGQYRYLDFWLYLDKPGADLQLQVQVDDSWGKRWGFEAGPQYDGYGWTMEGTTANLAAGRWLHLRMDLIEQLHIQAGQAITGLAFSSDNADAYYDSVYLQPSDAPLPAPAVRPSGKKVLEDDAGPYQWIEPTTVQKEVVAYGQAAFRATGNNHFTGNLGVVGDYPEQFRSLSLWVLPIGPEADIQIQVQVDGNWGKRWGFDAGPTYNGYGWAMEGSTGNLKPGVWQELTLDLIRDLHINPGQKITGLAFSSDNGDVYYDSVYLRANPNPALKPAFQPAGKRVLEDDNGGYNWVEASEIEDYLVFNGSRAYHATGNNHFLADLGAAGNAAGQYRTLGFWAFFMGPEADLQLQVQVNGNWGKRWGYEAGPSYNGYGWTMEGTTANMPNGRWTWIQADLLNQLHLNPGDRITGLAFSSDNADVVYDSVYLLPAGTTPATSPGAGTPPAAAGGASLSLDRTQFAPGESIAVHFTAPAAWPRDAWVGIVPAAIPHGNERQNDNHDITYQYLERRTTGTLTFTAPGVGDWDFRLHDTDNNGTEQAYASFRVATPGAGGRAYTGAGGRDYTGVVSGTPIAGSGGPETSFQGHSYRAILVPGGITWADADRAARALGGYLAVVSSAAENDAVYGLVKNDDRYWYQDGYRNGIGPWLGGLQPAGSAEPRGGWTWVSGEAFAYSNWAAGEPNNSGGAEDRLHLFASGAPKGPYWNDLAGGTASVRGYIVEFGDPGQATPGQATPGGRAYTGAPIQGQLIFEVGNIGGTRNGPTGTARFTLNAPHMITLIRDYHWNSARGAVPGSITLKGQDGSTWGPWQTTGTPGQGGVANAYWTATPNVVLPAGTYTVVDSDPASWSHNAESGGRGFVRVEGYPSAGPAPAPSAPSSPSRSGSQVDQLLDAVKSLKGLKGLFGK